MHAFRLIQHILLIVAVALYGIAPAGPYSMNFPAGAALSDKWAAGPHSMHGSAGAHSMQGHAPTTASTAPAGIEGTHKHCADPIESGRTSHQSEHSPQDSGTTHTTDCCQGSACAQGCVSFVFLITGCESRDRLLAPATERFSGWRVTLTSLSVPPLLRPPIA